MRSFFMGMYLGAIFMLPGAVFGQEGPGIRALSFGGAYRAVADSNDVMFYNPAGLIKYHRLGVDASYLTHWDTNAYDLGASIVDAKTTSWGLGLAYFANLDPQRSSTHFLNLSVALPIIRDRFFLGSSIYYKYDSNQEDYRHFFNLDLALMATAPLGLSVAAVLDHLVNPKGFEKGLGLSLALAFDLARVIENMPLTLSVDWVLEDLKSQESLNHLLSMGGQYIFFKVMPIRLGFMSKLKTHDNFISLGSGFLAGALSFDAVYQQHLAVGRIRNFGLALRFDF